MIFSDFLRWVVIRIPCLRSIVLPPYLINVVVVLACRRRITVFLIRFARTAIYITCTTFAIALSPGTTGGLRR